MKRQPIAFMSYASNDDKHDGGKLTQFRERLSGEVQMQTGEEFDIFQDRKHILWGQNWKERIEESLDAVTFLIPIITPSFFNSSYCREELQRFLERERKLNRSDLILPVYYVSCPLLDEEAKRANDKMGEKVSRSCHSNPRGIGAHTAISANGTTSATAGCNGDNHEKRYHNGTTQYRNNLCGNGITPAR